MLNFKFNRHLKLILCTCLMSCLPFAIGCSYIFSSIILSKLKEPTSTIKIDTEDSSWIASFPILVCPIGLLIVGIITDKLGRRKALQFGYIPIIISWLVLTYANSLKAIMIGRIMQGISLGSGTCVYLYLAEVCPTEYRPLYFSVVTIFVGMGMVAVSVMSLFIDWQTISLILFVVCTVNCASLFLVPETPMWLRTHGRSQEADAAEAWLCMEPETVPASAVAPVSGMTVNGDDHLCSEDGTTATGKPTNAAYWTLFASPTVWKPALITMLFFICQQGSGFYVLVFYSVDVLHDCRVQWDGVTVTAFLSLSRVIGSVVYTMLHHVRRKTLVVVSSGGMALSLATIIVYMRMYKDVASPPYGMVLVFAFITYVFFGLLAMLPLPWAICGEVFPMAVKGVVLIIVFYYVCNGWNRTSFWIRVNVFSHKSLPCICVDIWN
ncbi:hypothetical protein ACI65C_005364 [Semiaphis heraclei]